MLKSSFKYFSYVVHTITGANQPTTEMEDRNHMIITTTMDQVVPMKKKEANKMM